MMMWAEPNKINRRYDIKQAQTLTQCCDKLGHFFHRYCHNVSRKIRNETVKFRFKLSLILRNWQHCLINVGCSKKAFYNFRYFYPFSASQTTTKGAKNDFGAKRKNRDFFVCFDFFLLRVSP